MSFPAPSMELRNRAVTEQVEQPKRPPLPAAEGLHAIHAVASIEAEFGGPARSVPGLCDALRMTGVAVTLVTHEPRPQMARITPRQDVRVQTVPAGGKLTKLHELATGGAFAQAVARATNELDDGLSLVHVHGIWLPCNHAGAAAARRQKSPLVFSPRGMLSSWALNHHRWKKLIAWNAFQRRDLNSAMGLHATSHDEAEDFRRVGLRQPIAVIPNGLYLPDPMPPKVRPDARRRAVFVSRVHPKKGLPNLLQAWKQVVADDWELVIHGPDEGGHSDEVRRLAAELGLSDRVTLPGEVGDEDKWKVFREADLFVLPSHSENFGIVVAEALAAGLPVIATTGTPWQVVAEERIGWWVDPTVAALAEALREATTKPREELDAMGARAETWFIEQSGFSWEEIGRQMHAFYEWLLSRGERPDCVYTD